MRYNLSEITGAIKDRRSIFPESFSDRRVQKEQIELLLNNAIWAPSHKLTQPWRFKVFMEEGKTKLGEFLRELYLKKIPKEEQKNIKLNRNTIRSNKSSAVVVVCMERDKEERIPEWEEIAAVAMAVQNMYISCSAYGLACSWSTPRITQTDEMKEFLGLNQKDKCMGLFYIGYPEGEWPKNRRRPIEYVTEWIEK